MAKKKFSDLPATTSIGASDLLATSQVDADAQSGYTSKKITGGNVARSINAGIEYPTDLETEDKTIIGAINEINSNALAIDSASGDIASFDTAISAPLKSLSTTIVATGGGGTPSTPIPIVGYSELNLVRCGRNFFDIDWLTDIGVERGTLSVSGESVTVTATSNDCFTNYVAARWPEDKRIKVKEGDVVRLRWEKSGEAGRCGIFANGGTSIGFKTEDNSTGLVTYTIPAGCTFITIRLGVATAGESVTYSNIMVTINDETSTFNPYNGQTITLALGQTIYGGRLYFENGWKCDVTWGAVDLGSLEWTTTGTVGVEVRMRSASLQGIMKNAASSSSPTNSAKCSCYHIISADDTYTKDNEGLGVTTGGVIVVYDNNYPAASDLPSFITSVTGQMLAYELATPFTIDLSSSDMLDAVIGTNNVFSDCGVTSLTFIDKMQHYVDKKIAELQALILQ